MQAYDMARAFSDRRCVSVVDFMDALLPPSKYYTLRQSMPTSCPKNHQGGQKTFEAIFHDYGMWFNHVIKIEETEMISIASGKTSFPNLTLLEPVNLIITRFAKAANDT
jgi:hypothetical protein